jgi:hypothetical protein
VSNGGSSGDCSTAVRHFTVDGKTYPSAERRIEHAFPSSEAGAIGGDACPWPSVPDEPRQQEQELPPTILVAPAEVADSGPGSGFDEEEEDEVSSSFPTKEGAQEGASSVATPRRDAARATGGTPGTRPYRVRESAGCLSRLGRRLVCCGRAGFLERLDEDDDEGCRQSLSPKMQWSEMVGPPVFVQRKAYITDDVDDRWALGRGGVWK